MFKGAKNSNFKHGLSKSGEHSVWAGMLSRCGQSGTYKGMPSYAGRGIKVCEEWLGKDGFVTFLHDMGVRPSEKHSIDRIDNDGGYSKSNCQWALAIDQANNRRATVKIGGESLYKLEKQGALKAKRDLVRNRLNRGWSAEEAVSEGKNHSDTMKAVAARPETKYKRSQSQRLVKANPVFFVNKKLWFNSPAAARLITGIGGNSISRSATNKKPISQGKNKGSQFLWESDAIRDGFTDNPAEVV